MNRKPYLFSTIFAISMAFFESAVVVYLRHIAYPEGFSFPLKPLDQSLSITELWREVFSMIMLLSVAFVITRNRMERFAWFIYNFAIWDIFYYIFLKLILGWPASFLTMDILFLIPFIWTGPVIAPILLSILMIVLALSVLKFTTQSRRVHFKPLEIWLLIGGSIISIFSFLLDYLHFFVKKEGGLHEIWSLKMHTQMTATYTPEKFYWGVFAIGAGIITLGILLFIFRNKRVVKGVAHTTFTTRVHGIFKLIL